ncbi:MAG: hypothetical protein BWX98_00699 [Candidatus Aminicenantes bacterium ADurb.Bin147]|nr:MAG: hypothetical protein BWX98_00699 [Candidatus Aminicenantes bacterium ADurb.Bin147]
MPPSGDRPALMAPTFHPDVDEFRWIRMTRAGFAEASGGGAEARAAAIGMPTTPAPTTAIFSVFITASRPAGR